MSRTSGRGFQNTSSPKFTVPVGVWASFLRLATNRRIFTIPTPLHDAWAFIDAVTAQPHHLLLGPGGRHLALLRKLCNEGGATGDLVPDAAIGAVLSVFFGRPASDAERFTYKSVGGLEIEAWLMKPYGYEPGKKYPLVLYIHGGPHSAYGENWFDEFQNLAGAGMWVLYTNPRGSSGYGADFTYATRGRWGAEDYEDLMKAVDIAAARPDVDSTRMGVTGGSYGGFMTAWITTKTNRFKAAVTIPVIGIGGIATGEDAAEFLLAGAAVGCRRSAVVVLRRSRTRYSTCSGARA